MRPVIRDINFSIHQAFEYLGTVRPYTATLVTLFVAADLLWYKEFEIVQYTDLTFMTCVGILRTLVQGACAAALSYDFARRLLLSRAAKSGDRGSLLSSFFLRYLVCVVIFTFMSDLGSIFCLLGDSSSGPGRMLDNLSWGSSGMLWLLCALYFPRLAIGLPGVSMWRSIREMRAAPLLVAARLAGSALLVLSGTWVVSIGFLILAQGFRIGEQMTAAGWIIIWMVGDLAAVCAFTSMACLLFSSQRQAEISGLPALQ